MHEFPLIPYSEYKEKQKEFNYVNPNSFYLSEAVVPNGFLAIHLSLYKKERGIFSM